MTGTNSFFLRSASFCAFAAPLFLLAADILQVVNIGDFAFTIIMWLSFVLFVPAVFGTTYLAGGPVLSIVGGIFAFIGSMAGASMQVLFRVWIVLSDAQATTAIETLQKSKALLASTQMIGIFFPIGLFILALSFYKNNSIGRIGATALALGAILFPVGHAAGIAIALIGADILLIATFWLIGKRLRIKESI